MKILLKLVYLSGLFGLLAATSDDSLKTRHSALASQVECGNRTWTHDEFLGNYNGQAVYTIISDNRIYIRWDGRGDQSKKNNAFDNTAILLHMDTNRFPNDPDGNYVVNRCVNAQDPSTANPKFLTSDASGNALCNNKSIPQMLIGTYIGGDGVKTFLTSTKDNNLYRVTFRRETSSTDSPLAFGMGLIWPTYSGENKSTVNPDFHFSYEEVIGCFWDQLPKYPDRVVENNPNCGNAPEIQTISDISNTSLRVDIDGTDSISIKWKIKSGANEVRSGTADISGSSVNLSFNSLFAGNYTLEIEGGNCTSAVSSGSFTIASTGTLQPCQEGPNLLAVQESDANHLTFKFHGNGIQGIAWKIMQNAANGNVVRESTVVPNSSTPGIQYETLPTGVYYLQIQGSTCLSAVSSGEQGKFGVNVTLPIYISAFKASVVKKGIELAWKVVAEKNGEGFEILRFGDEEKTAEVIGKVNLTEQGLGNYRFGDENPLTGMNYYQLKQIDKDGSFIKSKIVAVRYHQLSEAVIAPNPVKDYVNIQFTSRKAGASSMAIYNMAGIKLSGIPVTIKEGVNNHRIYAGKMADGNYILKVSYGDQASNLRFMKVN